MNTLLERFITPRMVSRYYDKTIFASPLFYLLTVLFLEEGYRTYRLFRGDPYVLVVLLVSFASVWTHLVFQHRWFAGDDPQILKTNAARTTLAFGVLYLLTAGIFLSLPR